MKRLILFSMLFFPFLLDAQTTVKGIVTEQNSGNKPIAGVQIKALGASPELTDNAGLFLLVFKTKKPGDQINVIEISKKGYEIVNKDVVNNWFISNDNSNKTKIIMCTEGLIAQNTLKYYNISLTELTKGYDKRIRLLQEQKDKAQIDAKAYGEHADFLAQQLENQQKQLEVLAEKFARENFDDCSLIHQQAFEAFKLGNIEEAIRILESVNSDIEIVKAKQQQRKAETMFLKADSIIQQNIAKLIFQAELYVSSFRFQDAEKSYETAVIADTTNFKSVYIFANFLKKQKQFDKAIKWNIKALALAVNDYDRSYVLNNMADLQSDMNLYDKAEENYIEALKIYRVLAKTNPQVYNPDVAMTLNGLAILQSDMNQYNKSEANYNEVLKIYRAFAKTNPQVYNTEVAMTLNNLGVLQKILNQNDKAEVNFTEALNIYRLFARTKPQVYNQDVAMMLVNLAVLQYELKQYDKAFVNYAEALKIYRELAITNPYKYKESIALTLINLAILHSSLNQYEKAEPNYNEALKIYTESAKINPYVYNPYLAKTLVNFAILHQEMKIYDKAGANYAEAVKIYRDLAAINPQVYNIDLAWTLNNMANLQSDLTQYDKAEVNYNEALKINNELVISNPKIYNSVLAENYAGISCFHIKRKQFLLAEISARKGLETDSTQLWIQTNLALSLLFQGKYEDAKNIYIKYKDQEYPDDNTKTFKNQFLQDLDELEKKGITHPDVAKIREILNK